MKIELQIVTISAYCKGDDYMLKRIAALVIILCLALSSASASAVTVYVDGKVVSERAVIYSGSTYVPLRAVSGALCSFPTVSWNGKTASVESSNLLLSATPGSSYIEANGRYIYASAGVKLIDGTTLVPIRALAKATDADVVWDSSSQSVHVYSGGGAITAGSSFYDANDLYWLSRIISSESRGESLTGKIAVGNVVLNRVASTQFPNTIYEVIFDRKYGVQFEPTQDGSIYEEPTEESIIAAKLCLDGAKIFGNALYFLNVSTAESLWITANRPYISTIGNHSFYA